MQNIKYLAIGLVIGILLFFVFLAVIFLLSPASLSALHLDEPTQATLPLTEETPSLIPALPTSTRETELTPIPTALPTEPPPPSPLPSPTLSPGEILQLSGELMFVGPLTAEEQVRLYEASLQFVAPTSRASKAIGERINGIGYGSPTLICGPLSIAILQTAGLVGESVIPHDFWLLNPDIPKDRLLANRTFPPGQYENPRHKIRLDQFDWISHPLLPGDFLYIYHGPGGNFDHMLVVNRVDSRGRAYSVTNYGTPEGFIIGEVLLYDPSDPTAGMFQTWTERENQMLGSTGFDGFKLWRRIITNP